MRFTVVWNPSAESQLAEIWLKSNDRAGVSHAANAIEHELGRSPRTVGESRFGDRRVAIVLPLAVHFTVDDADRIVRVLSVRQVEREK